MRSTSGADKVLRREVRRADLSEAGDGESFRSNVFFQENDRSEFKRLWKKVRRGGLSVLTDDERQSYHGFLSVYREAGDFEADFSGNCLPELKEGQLSHPGIRATLRGILIPAEIPPKYYRQYHSQINDLRRRYFPSLKSLKRGPERRDHTLSDYLPIRLVHRIRKRFISLVYGPKQASLLDPSADWGTLRETLKDQKKITTYDKARKVLAKEFKQFQLHPWKIRLATDPAPNLP